MGDLNQRLAGAIVVATVAAAVIEHAILGGAPVFTVPAYALIRWWELIVYAAFGVISGFAATFFVNTLLAMRMAIRRWRLPGWLKPAFGGLLMAVIGLGAPEVFGIGYGTLSRALLGELAFRRMASLSAFKPLATIVSYAFGLSGGIFAPVLFVGGMLGGAVGHLVERFITASPQSVGSFALVVMGAFFVGAIRAPITSILIIFEMTGDYAIILPLMISNMLSYTIAVRFQGLPIYDALLQQDGVPIEEHHRRGDLRHITVDQVMKKTATPEQAGAVKVFADQTLDLALLTLGRHGLLEVPVVARASPDAVVGVLTLQDISGGLKDISTRSHEDTRTSLSNKNSPCLRVEVEIFFTPA